MARTRASKGSDSTAKADSSGATTSVSKSKYTISQPSQNPPKVFILPKKATDDARIVSLLHPRYAKPTRYLVCPQTGFYEFTRIAAPKSTPQSWLIQADECQSLENPEASTRPVEKDAESFGTYVTNGAELFVATPIDPLFLILPTLIDPSSKSEKRRYISGDDHFDRIQEESPHLWEILRWGEGRIRELLETRLGAVCETVEAGDERMFRFSEDKLTAEILSKARRMSARPLPQSMEEKFVVKPLEAPVLGVKRETTTTTASAPASAEAVQNDSSAMNSTNGTPRLEASETGSSGSSAESGSSFASEASTAATSVTASEDESQALAAALQPAMVASDEVVSLQRLRTAFNFLCSSYAPASLVTILRAKLSALPEADFAPLDTYLSEVNRLRQEAAAARSAGDYSRKRVLDEEELAERAEKKRKKEEEDKRKKAGESRGVRELKKVNTAGMKKMSDFFKKKA
ncbi:ribonuclease H2, subunit B [Xylaria bambusicola]|uniref:ribonuclease H2, subunit B n=1 Tax=Xylaria bambusicola TaxID=326684 RepID=UPI002007E0CD|nr:ribonuclease H2, subunit B [Xylaria bambusicola]KAI0514935.1 ribonuclease H2, subunit B [Xylaria bambusicola]